MQLLNELKHSLPAGRVFEAHEVSPRHRGDWGMSLPPPQHPAAVVYPCDAAEVSTVLVVCGKHACPVVPQGGLTGLTGGATPADGWVVLSLERMRAIEQVDTAAATITVQAGATLQAVQAAAVEAGLFFPLDLGAKGSCHIGGNIATNAGGNRVLRYGMSRDLVLGMEVVLADGSIVTSLNKMQKNNAGYDFKQMFIGSEGTLGIVTRVVLRLYPATSSVCTALCAVNSYADVVALLRHAKTRLGPTLSAFEVMWPDFYDLAVATSGQSPPLDSGHGAYVLIDTLGTDAAADEALFEDTLGSAFEQKLIGDAAVAKSLPETANLWALRELPGEFTRMFSPHIDFDVSIAIGDIGEFVDRCRAVLARDWPDAHSIFWGHIADSNVHLAVHLEQTPTPHEAVSTAIYTIVREFGGSISAEHGIGLLKKPFLELCRSDPEIELMRRMKRALDPGNILNPGKVV